MLCVFVGLWGPTSVEGVERCEPSTLSKFRQAQEGKALTSDVVEGKFKYSINLDGTGKQARRRKRLLEQGTTRPSSTSRC